VDRAVSTGKLGAGVTKLATPASRLSSTMVGRAAVTFVILLGLAAGGLFILRGAGSPAGLAKPSAAVTFFDSNLGQPGDLGQTDSAKIVAQGLSAPAAGSSYYAWLINTSSESITALGVLKPAGNGYSVTFVPVANGTTSSTILLNDGNEVEITLEHGIATVPVGRVVLSGSFPPKTFLHIQHLLVSFQNWPNALLVGSLVETQHLDAAAHTLQSAVGHSPSTVQCAAQSILNILEGAGASDYRQLPSGCTTDSGAAGGYALVGAKFAGYETSNADPSYLDDASAHAALAGQQSDATSYIKLRVRDADEAITNANTHLKTVLQDALTLLGDPGNAKVAADLVSSADIAYLGTGTPSGANASGLPNALSGGVLVAYEEAQLMATLTLS
jgi:hypothetical protein